MTHSIAIAPSILSADLLQMQAALTDLEQGGADYVHVDVMDGHYVPNLTFGPNMVAAVKRGCRLPADVHLMITNAEHYIETYVEAGADILTVHAEAVTHLHRVLTHIKSLGIKAGVSINPATPIAALEHVIEVADLVLIMSVNPGFGGQYFIPGSVEKVAAVRALADERNPELLIEVDGGITRETAPLVAQAGANLLVAGNAIFSAPDRVAEIDALRQVAQSRLMLKA